MKTEDIISELESIELKISELRLALTEQELDKAKVKKEKKEELSIGDNVEVLNPNVGQEKFGKVIKINPETGWVTIKGRVLGLKIRRTKKYVKKITS